MKNLYESESKRLSEHFEALKKSDALQKDAEALMILAEMESTLATMNASYEANRNNAIASQGGVGGVAGTGGSDASTASAGSKATDGYTTAEEVTPGTTVGGTTESAAGTTGALSAQGTSTDQA